MAIACSKKVMEQEVGPVRAPANTRSDASLEAQVKILRASYPDLDEHWPRKISAASRPQSPRRPSAAFRWTPDFGSHASSGRGRSRSHGRGVNALARSSSSTAASTGGPTNVHRSAPRRRYDRGGHETTGWSYGSPAASPPAPISKRRSSSKRAYGRPMASGSDEASIVGINRPVAVSGRGLARSSGGRLYDLHVAVSLGLGDCQCATQPG